MLLCIVRMLVCAGVTVCVCVCVCARARARALRIVSKDKILRFKTTLIIIYYYLFCTTRTIKQIFFWIEEWAS